MSHIVPASSAVIDTTARLNFARQVPAKDLFANLGRWSWSPAAPLPPMKSLQDTPVWTSARYATLRATLSAPRLVVRTLQPGGVNTIAVDLFPAGDTEAQTTVVVFTNGKVPDQYGRDAFRAALVRARLGLPDLVAAVAESHVPILLFGSQAELSASQRHLASVVPGLRGIAIRVFVRPSQRNTLGRELLFDETSVVVCGTPASEIALPLPNYIALDADEVAGVADVPHVAIVGAFWRSWVRASVEPASAMLVIDQRVVAAGILARSLPDCPKLFVATSMGNDDAREELEAAYRRLPPPGQTPARVNRAVESFLQGSPFGPCWSGRSGGSGRRTRTASGASGRSTRSSGPPPGRASAAAARRPSWLARHPRSPRPRPETSLPPPPKPPASLPQEKASPPPRRTRNCCRWPRLRLARPPPPPAPSPRPAPSPAPSGPHPSPRPPRARRSSPGRPRPPPPPPSPARPP